MRLKIYDYLLDASRWCASILDSESHCCWIDAAGGSAKCTCAKPVYLSVLRVNKLVNQEATPVLNATLELRIDTPMKVLETGNTFDHSSLWKLPQAYDHQVLPISNLVFVTTLMKLPVRIDIDEKVIDQLTPLWSRLSARPFNIKAFRLYLRYDCPIGRHSDYEELLGLLILPRLQRLKIEILLPACERDDIDLDNASNFLRNLQQKAKDKIDELGRKIEVCGLLREEAFPPSDEGQIANEDDISGGNSG